MKENLVFKLFMVSNNFNFINYSRLNIDACIWICFYINFYNSMLNLFIKQLYPESLLIASKL